MTGKRFSFLLLLVALALPVGAAQSACDQQVGRRVSLLLHKLEQQLEQQQFSAAIEQIETFKTDYPDERHYLIDYHLGNLYAQAGRPDAALSAYTAAIAGCANEAGLWQNQAKVAWDLKQYSVAAQSLLRAYELEGGKDPSLLFHAAVAHIYAGDKQAALDLLESLLTDAGNSACDEWLETYVNLCLEENLVARALGRTQDWRSHFEERGLFWRLRALLHVHIRDYQQAAADLQVLAAFGPLKQCDKKLLADLLLQIDLPLEAAPLYEELLQVEPRNRDLHDLLITSYRLGLQPQQALAAIDRGLKIHVVPDWLQSKGELLFEQGRYEQAYAVFSKLLDRDPERGPVYLYRGYCAIRMEKPALARQALKSAMRFKHEAEEARRLLSWLNQG